MNCFRALLELWPDSLMLTEDLVVRIPLGNAGD